MGKYNPQYHRDRAQIHLARVNEILKSGTCFTCGESETCVLDFHHVNPSDKKDSPKQGYRSWKWIEQELAKCVILCCNCHRRVHHVMVLLGCNSEARVSGS